MGSTPEGKLLRAGKKGKPKGGIEELLQLLQRHDPDVLCLQEVRRSNGNAKP
jgi:exonuclease III